MAGKIQNKYTSLVRELDISEYAPNYEMTDAVVPVVLLHEHCEGERFGMGGTAVGPVGIGDLTTPILIPRAGAYQISIFFQCQIAIALVGTAKACLLVDRVANAAVGTLGRTLFVAMYGQAGMQSVSLTMTYPKLHFEEGREVVWVIPAANNLLANDGVSFFSVFQPV